MLPKIPRSVVDGIVWPALTGGPAAVTLALHYQFRRSERWDPETLEAAQFAQSRNLLAHAARTMPFWRSRLREAGIGDGSVPTADIWARIPILRRAEAQEAGSALHCLSVPPAHGTIGRKTTSGSTGTPLTLLKSDLQQIFWDACLLRDQLWHRIDLRGRWASLRRDPWDDAGPDQALQAGTAGPRRFRDLGPGIASVFPTGPISVFEIRRSIPEQADWMLREDPDYLSTFPTNLVELAQHFRDIGRRPRRLRAVQVFSEAVTPHHRALARGVMGVEMLDNYSAEEIGCIALQCPAPIDPNDPGLHVMAETVKLEILDARDRPCPPGVVGRVVITSLHGFAMPLIRYELGDYAEFAPPGACNCGRTLPLLRAIRGRLRHGLRMPDGTSRAAFFGIPFARIPAIRQYQAAQVAPTTIELRLVTRRPLTPDEEAQLAILIRNDTDPGFTVRFAYVDAIPRLPNGKYEEFRCELA